MRRASAPSYDLFKLIVTIVLLAILLLMLLRGCANTPVAAQPTESDPVSEGAGIVASPAQTETSPVTESTASPTPSAVPAADEPSATPATAASPTLLPTESASTPTTTPTAVAAEATTEPTQVPEASATPGASSSTSCNTSMPTRLSVGQDARVVQRLNMRTQASITAPIMQTNTTNTQVEVIGGPVCQPVGEGAYLWWQIRLPDGVEGWSAETPLNEASYLLEPVP